MQSKRVGILTGGASAERETSLRSGRAVEMALEQAGHEVTRIEISAQRDPAELIRRAGIDTAFIALQGRFGEDGCVQGLLELLGIPYTGSGVLETALAADKLKSKELFRLHNVPTPAYYVYSGSANPSAIRDAHGSFGFPAMVRPRREGTRVGCSRARGEESLVAAVLVALEHDGDVLVERFVHGKQVTVGILDGRVLGAFEVVPMDGTLDPAGRSESHMPAQLTPALYKNVLFLAERAAEALGVSGAVCVDMTVTESQNESVLEVNALPDITPTSVFPRIAAAAGYGFVELCVAMLASAKLHVPGARPNRNAAVLPIVGSGERTLRAVAG